MPDPRLGRIFRPDPRDRAYLMERAIPVATPIGSKLWTIPYLYDQGQTPQCVGYSCSNLMTGIRYAQYNAEVDFDAAQLYAWANANDGDPTPHDGTTVRSGFQGLVTVGDQVEHSSVPADPVTAYEQLTNYLWADMNAVNCDVDRIITWLLTIGPVVIGIPWLKDMFDTDAKGFLSCTGAVEGGHAICVRGVQSTSPGSGVFVLRNSWGPWGVTVKSDFSVDTSRPGGDALLRRVDLIRLLSDQGEAGAPVSAVHVPPTPTPTPPPAPTPTPPPPPSPTPTPPPTPPAPGPDASRFLHVILKELEALIVAIKNYLGL